MGAEPEHRVRSEAPPPAPRGSQRDQDEACGSSYLHRRDTAHTCLRSFLSLPGERLSTRPIGQFCLISSASPDKPCF